MIDLDVHVETRLFDRTEECAAGGNPDELRAALGQLVSGEPEFGAEGQGIANEPEHWFPLRQMGQASFWARQRALLDYLQARMPESVMAIRPFVPPVPDDRRAVVVVDPVPGLRTCYGNGRGHQIFGLYDGAAPEEMLLFLSHTYYHELTNLIATPASRQAEAAPTTGARLRHLLMLLTRNEGIANYAVLAKLRELRSAGTEFRYFTYAPMVDDPAAVSKALGACRELLQRISDDTVTALLPRVKKAFKNPRLPIINLVGIHLADAIVRHLGEVALLDVAGREPQEFFRLYARTRDPGSEILFGSATEPDFTGFDIGLSESGR
jgi:hypothetical protein